MPKPRLKKFERAEVADPLKLQPRDFALLRDVAEFRFLNTPQIFALHPGGKRNLSRRLFSLFEQIHPYRLEDMTSARWERKVKEGNKIVRDLNYYTNDNQRVSLGSLTVERNALVIKWLNVNV